MFAKRFYVRGTAVLLTSLMILLGTFTGVAGATADTTKPIVTGVIVSSENKVITVKFSENIYNATSSLANLKAGVQLSTNDGVTFNGLALADRVLITRDSLVITLKSGLLNVNTNKIKVKENLVKDLAGNKTDTAHISSALVLDTLAPTIRAVGYNSITRRITVYFNENIKSANTFTDKSGLFTLGGSSITPSSVKILSNTLTIMLNTYTAITESTTLSFGSATQITDRVGNAIGTLSSTFDLTAPRAASSSSYVASNDNKNIEITLNESVVAARTLSRTFISIIPAGASAKNLTYIRNSGIIATRLSVSGNKLTITNLAKSLVNGDRISIKSGILQDVVKLKNTTILLTMAGLVDVTPPVLTAISVNEITSTSLKVNYTSNEIAIFYIIVQDAVTAAPTAATMQSAYDGTGPASAAMNSVTIGGQSFTAGYNGKAYVMLKDLAGNVSVIGVTSFTVGDLTAPVLTSVGISGETIDGATLNFDSNEAGTYYYLILEDPPAATPDATEIMAQGTAVAKGTSTATVSTNTVTVSGLSAGTNYAVYLVVKDAAGNVSLVSDGTFSTVAEPI